MPLKNETKRKTDEEIIASGPTYINWIRFGLILLFYTSILINWKRTNSIQNILYLSGTTAMFLNFIYSFYKIRKTGSISHTLSKVFLLVDVLVQLVVMMGATMDHPDFTTGVVKSPILYGISYMYIVTSGLLLVPNFVLWIGF